MGEGAPSGGFRLFQSQHSRQQRRGLLDVPWTGQPDAARLSSEHVAYAMVPGLPSGPRAGAASERSSFQYGLEGSRQSGRIGRQVEGGVQDSDYGRAGQLLDLSPVIKNMSEPEHHEHTHDGHDCHDQTERVFAQEAPLDLNAVRARLQSN